MGPAPISTAFLLASLLAVILAEAGAYALGAFVQLPRLWSIAFVRSVEMLAVGMLAVHRTGGLQVIGLGRQSLLPGLRSGLIWSAGFAAVAGLAALGLGMAGFSPLAMIRTPLPPEPSGKVVFFLVGGIVAPAAEEIVFRGLLFGYLRRWGVPAAVLISTALFAAIHPGAALPVTQIVGGVVFAVAYQASKSLVAPMIIHMLGNLAIFSLSLFAA